jgi:uncharacterized membrane protein
MARAQLKGGWLLAVGVCLIFGMIISISGFVVVGPFIIGGPLLFDLVGFFLNKARGQQAEIENLFDGFKRFVSSLLLYVFQSLFVCLWSLLFIVPGIIKSFSYSMAFYILRDNPETSAMDAITQSRKMMYGYKWRLFLLYFSFIGWCLLCLFTFGIGYLWLIPYVQQSVANFYEELKKQQTA